MKFNEIGFSDTLLKNITNAKYESTTGIQENVIPLVLEGKDVVGIAQTGTGKTAAFVLPIIEKLIKDNDEDRKTKVLVLSPTRELAIQTRDTFKLFTDGMAFKSGVVLGGVNQNAQIRVLKNGVDVLVATPGRLLDLINQGKVKLDNCSTLVLDEADTMLDMGFINDVKKIARVLPSKRQTLLFSATGSKQISELSNEFMNDPVTVKMEASEVPNIIDQKLYYVDKANKINLLFDILNTKDKNSTLIFTRTKRGADKLEKEFAKYDIKVSVIHGDKRQSNRVKALSDFKDGKTYIMIATDIASRGIDIRGLKQVINYDIPEFAQDYVHRIGRTGRAGEVGTSLTFCSSDDVLKLKDIQRLTNVPMEEVEHNFPMKENLAPEKRRSGHSASSSSHRSGDTGAKRYGKRTDSSNTHNSYHDHKKTEDGASSYGKKPYVKRDYKKSSTPGSNYGDHKSYGKKNEDGESSYGKKPYVKRDYKKSSTGSNYGDHKSYGKKTEDGESSYGKKTYVKRDYKKSSTPGSNYSDHKSYGKKTEDGDKSYAKKSYATHDYKKSGSSSSGFGDKKKRYGNASNSRSNYGRNDNKNR